MSTATVYILTNAARTVLYVGVTSNLPRRLYQHRTHQSPKSFTSLYNCHICIYTEEFPTILDAIAREKQIKKMSRTKKEALITAANPAWEELPI